MRWALAAVTVALLSAAGLAGAGTRADPAPQETGEEPSYDGRFTFVRIRYDTGRERLQSFGFRRRGREPEWHHDNPRAERNFAKILDATTLIGPHTDGTAGRILELDDPELFKYPLAYIVEVGYWHPTDAERDALGTWLHKGGFLIVDDFRGYELSNFEAQMARVLPEARLRPVPPDHEIFDSFFHIEDPYGLIPPYARQYEPVYLGLFEDDDPAGRLMVMVNYNNDIAEYWEYSDQGYLPIDLTNEAYKFGVNYVVYAMTH